MVKIIGAGLSGLIAATQFPQAEVIEANTKERTAHKAVLRFRSDSLSRLTGIPFRKVTVHKSIYYANAHHKPNIQLANKYSKKTNGRYIDRSIWNTDSVERFIAPPNLQEQLIEMVGNRITWGKKVSAIELLNRDNPIISTMPMPLLIELTTGEKAQSFKFSPIKVDRYLIKGADVHQTIYYPSECQSTYRASITGDMLIIEHIGEGGLSEKDFTTVLRSFGLHCDDVEAFELNHVQRFGKILPISEAFRRNFIFSNTALSNIYSLGRFAIWKNILLDDVVADVQVIKGLINQGAYAACLHNSKRNSK